MSQGNLIAVLKICAEKRLQVALYDTSYSIAILSMAFASP